MFMLGVFFCMEQIPCKEGRDREGRHNHFRGYSSIYILILNMDIWKKITCFIYNLLNRVKNVSRLHRKISVKKTPAPSKMKILKIPTDKSLIIWILNFCQLEFLIFSFLKALEFFLRKTLFFSRTSIFSTIAKKSLLEIVIHPKSW